MRSESMSSRPIDYNGTNASKELPHELRFNEGHIVTIVTYSILIVISTIGNITVLTAMWRRRRKSRTRINTMLMHLAIADLIVTFLMMPLEIFWAATVEWIAGDAMCRVSVFFRIFGLYLSSFIIICISVDRYLAVLKPMNLYQVDQRGKIMLTSAWLASVICSAPQSIIFHVESHPEFHDFKQCVMFNSFQSKYQELAYLYSGMIIMYLLPLAVIIFCYTSIVIEIFKRSTETNIDSFRRSGLGFLGRARSRTLKMTIIIVVVFIICWTPYYVMAVWFWIDDSSAKKIDHKVQRFLLLFASTNSCMNPIVYGIFNIRTRRSGGPLERGRAYSGRISYATDIRLPALTLSLRSVE
ncbi:adipokinetic hormone/corazonin-related peptide receptor variant I-like [Planococcus citri]|uniref:adipokinetic hormone/corazonin-related peptide receptor variant I-like n=1 Tax=Planococcus citri TaxID=170843 RepID=UPI0031F965E0